jgi:hypothetical protein
VINIYYVDCFYVKGFLIQGIIFVVKVVVILIFFKENEILDKENHNLAEQLSKSEETRTQLQREMESLAGLQQRVCICLISLLFSDVLPFSSKKNSH